MRILYLGALLLVLSCSKPGSDAPAGNQPQNPPPDPPPSLPASPKDTVYRFGKIIHFKDTLKVYDGNTGELLVTSGKWGSVKNSYLNNTTIDGELAYQPTINRLVAVNLQTGAMQFTRVFSGYFYSFGGVSPSHPLVDGPRIFLAAYNNFGHYKLFCLDKLTGNILWESEAALSYDPDPYLPSPVQTPAHILVNTIDGPACFDKATGKLVWKNTADREFRELGILPVLVNGDKYIATSPRFNAAYCFDVKTGALLWKTALAPDMYLWPREIYQRHNTLYITSKFKNFQSWGYLVNCLDLNGTYLRTLDFADAYEVTYGGDHVFTATKPGSTFAPTRLNKYDLGSGQLLWQKDLEGGTWDGLTITPEFLYCTETDPQTSSGWQRMTILRQQDGKTLKTFPLYSSTAVRCVVVDSLNQVYRTNLLGREI